MITRHDVLREASEKCLKEIYKYVEPKITWDEFIEENKLYSARYKEWETFNSAKHRASENPKEWEYQLAYHPDWENKSISDCIGPAPYNFYYLPKEILKDIADSYIYSYKIDSQQNLLDIIEILKDYCKDPIIDKYFKDKGKPGDDDFEPGHRGYDHPDNLIEEVRKILIKYDDHMDSEISEEVVNKFFEFLDMAGKFFTWTHDLSSFNMTIYLGPSPRSVKEKVIENWKKYKGKDIEINEHRIKENYYGEDFEESGD